jgi:hypothetical protein
MRNVPVFVSTFRYANRTAVSPSEAMTDLIRLAKQTTGCDHPAADNLALTAIELFVCQLDAYIHSFYPPMHGISEEERNERTRKALQHVPWTIQETLQRIEKLRETPEQRAAREARERAEYARDRAILDKLSSPRDDD